MPRYDPGPSPFRRLVLHWLPIAVAVTMLAGLAYAAVQQSLRQTADDPQIQMAEDAATALAGGQAPQSLVSSQQVDIAKSLAPWLAIDNESGQPVISSGSLDGHAPALPGGVFAYTRQHGEDRLTWQPRPGVRVAVIIVHYGGARPGFALAGRSLREVENREDNIENMVALLWAASLVLTLLTVALAEYFLGNKAEIP